MNPPILARIPASRSARRLLASANGLPEPVPYRDLVLAPCCRCDRGVWVGPVQQLVRAERPGALVACLACAAILAGPISRTVALTDKKAGE